MEKKTAQTPDIFLEDGYTTIGKVTYVTELRAREYAKLYHSQRLQEAGNDMPFPKSEIEFRMPNSVLDEKLFGAHWMYEKFEPVVASLKSNLSAVQRFRAEDAMSHINEANQLRERIKEMEEKLKSKP